jgi:hypothetical protein
MKDYKLVPTLYKQVLTESCRKAIKAFMLIATRRPRDDATWREANKEPHANIRDSPMEKEKI